MDRRFDPRSIVTPYAFAVHPDLLGMPLATPWQRLGAILVDLVVVGFISQVGLGPLAISSTLLLFWLATRKRGRDVFGKLFRIAVGCLGFVVLTVTVLVVLAIRYSDDLERLAVEELGTPPPGSQVGEVGGAERDVGILDVVTGFRGVVDLQRASTREEAQQLLDDFARSALDAGLTRSQIRELLSSVIPQDAPWTDETDVMVATAMDQLETFEETPAEEDPGESGGDVEEAETVLGSVALDSIARLQETIRQGDEARGDLVRELQRTEEALEEERSQGALAWLWGLIDELGIGFGWAALYLTITHAWWKGTSIGKRLFRIRVVMIDKRPLNWWLSFERAGGYAAGFATGLLGFAQVFWDPNRQAIHDKVSETIVIQDGKKAVPGPWVQEGREQWSRDRHGNPGSRTP